jgi:hypothetical protein
MTYLNIILFMLLSMGLIYVIYLIKRNEVLEALNEEIGEEMKIIIENTIAIINTHREKIEGHRGQRTGDYLDDVFSNPSLMASILTAIVKKYGDIKVGLKDFEAIKNEDYISVYSDNTSKELILSLDHDLGSVDQIPKGFYSSDDGTFH